MKTIPTLSLLIPAFILCTSFISSDPASLSLENTKWISPVSDDCFDSLCFTSDKTVFYYRCEDGWSYEIGYLIKGDKIEIEAYSDSTMAPASKLVLYEDNGILRQPPDAQNSFVRNFIKVPDGSCN